MNYLRGYFGFDGLLVLFVVSFVTVTCTEERDFYNPFDSKISPEVWAPRNLFINTKGANQVELTWDQNNFNIDGFLLFKFSESSTQEIVLPKGARKFNDEEVRPLNSTCEYVSYGLCAYAGKHKSSLVEKTTPAKFPTPPNGGSCN